MAIETNFEMYFLKSWERLTTKLGRQGPKQNTIIRLGRFGDVI